jgi:hypothetical protein
MTEMTEGEMIALERRNYRRRLASTIVAIFVAGAFATAVATATEGMGRSPWPFRLTPAQSVVIIAIGFVLAFGVHFAVMLRFRAPRGASTQRMRLLRADDLQERAVRGLLWRCGFLFLGGFNLILQLHRSSGPQWGSAVIFSGVLFFVVHGLVTGIGLDASNLARPLNDELTREHRRRALARSYPFIMAAFAAAYFACFDEPSRAFWVFPLALTFSALLPAGLFAFWELQATRGD